jgi:uncharacterized protein DUF2846
MPCLARMGPVGFVLLAASLAVAIAQSTNPQNPTSKPAEETPSNKPAESAQDKSVPVESATKTASAVVPAHVYVYRQRRYAGSALAPSIFVDDKQVVRVGNGRRASIRVLPGPHTIRSDDKSSAISIEAKAGQDYFVRVDEETGFWKGHGKLTLIMPEQGSAEYKLQKPVEEDRKVAREMIEPETEEATSKTDAKQKAN